MDRNPNRLFNYSRGPVFPTSSPMPVPARSGEEVARVDRDVVLRQQVTDRLLTGKDSHRSWNFIAENIFVWNQIAAFPDPAIVATYVVPTTCVLVIEAVSYMWNDPWLQTSGMLTVALQINGRSPLLGAGTDIVMRHSDFWSPRPIAPLYVQDSEALTIIVTRNDPAFVGHMALSYYLSGLLVNTAGGSV